MRKLIRLVFYGNMFYGLCTVGLCIETNLQNGIALNSIPFYILTFLATVVYYSRIYYKTSAFISTDGRTAWFRRHRPQIKAALIASGAIMAADILYMFLKNFRALHYLPAKTWALIAIVPLIGIMYTSRILPLKQLRHVGWLKPFVIGFVWAGLATIFPILFWHIRHPETYTKTLLPVGMLWLQNFLFITALAVVFDIKDYQDDKKQNLSTFPATMGIQKTIVRVIAPLALLSFSMLIIFQVIYHVPVSHTIIQSLPYIALLWFSKDLAAQNNLLFYLAAIDGLMLLKAICGIVSILFF